MVCVVWWVVYVGIAKTLEMEYARVCVSSTAGGIRDCHTELLSRSALRAAAGIRLTDNLTRAGLSRACYPPVRGGRKGGWEEGMDGGGREEEGKEDGREEGGAREGEWEGAGGREWVGLVGGVRDALVAVHLNRSG